MHDLNEMCFGIILFVLALALSGCGGLDEIEDPLAQSRQASAQTTSSEFESGSSGFNTLRAAVSLYEENCAQCHSPIETTNKPDRTSQQIADAIKQVAAMKIIELSGGELDLISLALSSSLSDPDTLLSGIAENDAASLEFGKLLYNRTCVGCHGTFENSKLRKGEIDVAMIQYNIENEVEMQGIDLTLAELGAIVQALTDDAAVCRATNDPGPSIIRRLSNAEYINTVRDLTGAIITERQLPPDAGAGGFANIASGQVNFSHAQRYADLVSLISPAALSTAKNQRDNNIAGSHATCDVKVGSGTECAREILSNFVPMAYRRAVEAGEIDSLVDLYKTARSDQSNKEALKTTIEAVLLSPNFTFIVEDSALNNGATRALNGYELASRLSYFIWGSMPDRELFELASTDTLLEPEILTTQIDRMLADERSESLANAFFIEWMELTEFIDDTGNEYAHLSRQQRAAMVEESRQFFLNEFLRKSSTPLRGLLDSNTPTYVNQYLGGLYNLGSSLPDDEFQSVLLPDRHGLLTHASILSMTSGESSTKPVARGKWVLDRLLCDPPRDAPPDVPDIEDSGVSEEATLKEILAAHRSDPGCAACHQSMDAIGVGLESYGSIGEYREFYADGSRVDASSALPGGIGFNDASGLASALTNDPRFASCLVEKFESYARGVLADSRDKCRVKRISSRAEQSSEGLTMNSLIQSIVLNESFLTRRSYDAATDLQERIRR